MIEQFIRQPAQDLAVLAVDLDREADILFGDQHDDRLEPEHRAAVLDDPRPAIVAHRPAQSIIKEIGLGELQRLGLLADRHRRHRLPHLGALRRAEELPALRQFAVRKLDLEPGRHIRRAHRQPTRRSGIAPEPVTLVERFLIARPAQPTVHPRMRLGAVGAGEAIIVVGD